MIAIRRFLAPAATLLLLVALWGCSRSNPAQSANSTAQTSSTATSQDPNSSAQPVNNAATNDNAALNSPASAGSAAASNAASSPAGASQAAAPLTIPAGTTIVVRLQQSLSSASASPGEPFQAVIDQPLVVGDRVVVPVGSPATGHVTVARRSGRLRHPGELGLTLDTVTVGQQQIRLATAGVVARGRSHKRRNLGWIGGGSGGGALIGALAGGGKGALIGGGIGAVAGTTTAFITGKKNVGFGAERRLSFRLRYDVNLPS
jgi:hypothetical protein